MLSLSASAAFTVASAMAETILCEKRGQLEAGLKVASTLVFIHNPPGSYTWPLPLPGGNPGEGRGSAIENGHEILWV